MTEPDFNPLTIRSATRRNCPYRCEKYVGAKWVHVSDFRAPLDEQYLVRHVRALGESVRLLKSGRRVREWRNGHEVFP